MLLLAIRAKDRIPYYALFAYLAPLAFTLLSVLFDILLKSSLGSYRPCYAAYLDGCAKYQTIDLGFNKNNHTSLNNTECSHDFSNLNLVAILSRTCWITNGNANLVFFGLPIALVLILNAILFALAVFNIRRAKLKLKKADKSETRRFGGGQVREFKFYVQMAVILGFTWISGFFLTTFPSEQVVVVQILVYAFILSNGSIGVFIFFAFVFKRDTLALYVRLLRGGQRQGKVDCVKKREKKTTEVTSEGSSVTSGSRATTE